MWSVALVLGPVLRPDLDPLTAHPETYALGEWGFVMRLGYLGAAAGGAGAAFLARPLRVPAVLLGVFATGALGLALLPPTGAGGLADEVFPYLQVAPLALLPAIALIARRHGRRHLRVLAVLAWVLFLPLVIGDPPGSGLINRAADLAMAAWLAAFAREA